MKRVLSEPLLHFALLGLALFGLHAALARPDESRAAEAEIVVTAGRIQSLAETFARQWNRQPTEVELAGLVRDFVREEVLVREALALGLDRDDTIVRRRLAQKMEFLGADVAALVEPTDEELAAYLDAHPATFRVDARFTFRQVFLDRQARGAALDAQAAELLAALEAPGSTLDAESLGDSRMLPARLVDAPRSEVDAQFGAGFAARLEELEPGRWHWPVESAYGPHVVHMERRVSGRKPALAEVREVVTREWSLARRGTLEEARFQALLARYTVTMEEPPGGADVVQAGAER